MSLRVALAVCVFLAAVTCQAGNALPLGSLASSGTVRVSGVSVPSGTVVFAGDTIEAEQSSAVVTLREGDSVVLGVNASVRVSQAENGRAIELLRGMSRVQLHSRDVRLVASNWTLQPDLRTGRATADVVRTSEGTVSLNVRDGALVARNSAGKRVLVASGRPALLPAAALPSPAGPQAGAGSGNKSKGALVGAYVIGAAAIAFGAAALATEDDEDEQARAAAATAQQQATAAQTQAAAAAAAAATAQTQAAAAAAAAATAQAAAAAAQAAAAAAAAQIQTLTTANAALQAQVNTLIGQVAALQSFVQAQAPLLQQLAGLLAELQAAQSQLVAIQSQINQLVTILATRPLTADEQLQLAGLQAQQSDLSSKIGRLTSSLLGIIEKIQGVSPSRP